MKRVVVVGLTVALALWLGRGATRAQTVTGTILGNVTDPGGSVIPAALVTLLNDNTGLQRVVKTNQEGSYVAPLLPVGKYTVTIESTGFQKANFTGIILQVDAQLRLDVSLKVGAVTEVVEVKGAAPLIQTENASLGEVVDTQKILTLPLNGRNFLQLATLTPGVSEGGLGGEGLSVNGGRGDMNGYLMDGTANFSRFDGAAVVRPNVDAVQEFKVQTAAYSAEFGFGGNGQINVVTKSGTNRFHGSAYEFLRNRSLDARNFFDPPGPGASFKRNQYGGTFGGPIRGNKTFFFGDYEGLRIRQSSTIQSLIPTAEMKAGNFQGQRPIFDVLTFNPASGTAQPFANNQIPSNRISKVAAGLNAYYPQPNQADPRLNFINTTGRFTRSDEFAVRVDHQLSSKHQLFGRYGWADSDTFSPSNLPAQGTFNAPRTQLATLSDTFIISAQVINELRLGWNRTGAATISARTFQDDVAGKLGIGGISRDPLDFGFPEITILPNYAGVSDPSNPFPSLRKDSVYQVGNTTSITRSTHTIKFGAQLHRVELNGIEASFGRGRFQFDGRFTRSSATATNTGHEFADYLLGYAFSTQRQLGSTRVDMRSTYFGGFIQDDWKVSPRLTLNVGARYEVNTPLGDKYGRNSNVDWRYPGGLAVVVLAGDIGPVTGRKYEGAMYLQDSNNWAPRVGFAYRPLAGNTTAIRGGYGIFYGLLRGQMFTFQAQNPPRIVNENFNAQFPNPTLTFENGFQLNLRQPEGIASLRALEYDRADPYVQQWDLTVQRQIVSDLMVEVAYVGTKGTKLASTVSPNNPKPGPGAIQPRRPFPAISGLTSRESRHNSTYHAVQFKADKRFAHGLSFLTSYTFGKSLDDASNAFGAQGNGNIQDNDNIRAEHGRSAHDLRHNFVLSYIYELPFGRGKSIASGTNAVSQQLIGGWQIAGITSLKSGLSSTPLVSLDTANTGQSGGGGIRPNAVPGEYWRLDNPTPGRFFNTAAFRVPPAFQYGNLGRGLVDRPGTNNFDFSLLKRFPIREYHSLEFRAEFFDFFNHPLFNAPNLNVDNQNFGRIS